MTTSGTRTRLSAEERREQILEAAMEEFARGGLDGTPTEAIARRVGISQPYLFRLFRTKKDLFLAVVERCFEGTLEAFRQGAKGHSGQDALLGMGRAYAGLLKDRTRLLLQLQAYVACDDPDVRAIVRDGFRRLARFVAESSGASATDVRHFFETGMLMNVVAAMELDTVRQPWARDLMVPMQDKE
ncbi:MAG: TetR/AcrR family transcriptional regulator [Actinobacteria bacterium]|nr:TetR/AcrR family transcriptional regulator [Actinomycetota bacterium]